MAETLERAKDFDIEAYEKADPACREYMKNLFQGSEIEDEEVGSGYDLLIDGEAYELEMPGEDTWNLRIGKNHGILHIPARKINLVDEGWYYGISPHLDGHYRVRIEKVKKCQTKQVWCKNTQSYDQFFAVPYSWVDWSGCKNK